MEETALSAKLQLKLIYWFLKALLKHTSLRDSLEEENLYCQALHLIKQLWQITVVNLSMIKCHAR